MAAGSEDPQNAMDEENMDEWKKPKIELVRVKEVYPKLDSDDDKEKCHNGAKTVPLTQTYYMCEDRQDPEYVLRIDKKSYEYAKNLPYYQRIAKCYTMDVTKQACWCPKGFTGALCQEARQKKCYVHITDPNMAKPCSDDPENVDSEYYVYSIQGFDPCHKFDFDRSYKIKFRLQCQHVDKDGYLEPDPPKEELGFEYQDVVGRVRPPVVDYEYLIDDKKTGLVLS